MADQAASLTVCVAPIPSTLTVADVRDFFSDLVEASCFSYFHFLPSYDDKDSPRSCLARLKGPRELRRLIDACNGAPLLLQPIALTVPGQPWTTRQGDTLDVLCNIVRVADDLLVVRPPLGLPQGNVGTPVAAVRQAIRQLLIPPSAIKAMGIDFHRAQTAQRSGSYRRVPFTYEHSFSSDSDSSGEEWDRWEAAHGDEDDEEEHYLYEEEIEKKWEKGGSGLVHYTDAQVWTAAKGDADEQEMLKEHGDDWALHLEPAEKQPANKAFNPCYNGERKRKRKSVPVSTGKRRRGTWQERHYTEPEVRSDELEEASDEGKSKGAYNGMGRKYLEAHGWSDGQAIGHARHGQERLVAPLQAAAPSGHGGLGFDNSPHVPHVSRIVRPLEKRFVAAKAVAGVFDHAQSSSPS